MTDIRRQVLFGKLGPAASRAIESATGFCRLRGNPYVELVHWLHMLVKDRDTDVAALVQTCGLDEARLSADIVTALDRLPSGATAVSDFAPQIEDTVERGWLYASLLFGAGEVRTGHLLVAILKTPRLREHLFAISETFRRLSADTVVDRFETLVQGSTERSMSAAAADSATTGGTAAAPTAGGEALARYAVDLTARARAGEIDRIVGRDPEIRQMIDILLRRRQNNPILTGEAGVGKTAIVEGLARRIADGDVPPALADVSLHALDLGLLQAGAGVKGEFEKRLRQVIDEVETAAKPVILFVDEAHTLIGAGGQAGTGDAANLLKPALARGRLRTIAATTWAEYRQYVEKDPALSRRFQPVAVGEPDDETAVAMLRSVREPMERHHGVTILDEALDAAVRLSQRYIPARQLPDKAVSLLDTAAARVGVSQHATPARVEDARSRIARVEAALEAAEREQRQRYADGAAAAPLAETLELARATLVETEAQWRAERDAVAAIHAARDALGDDEATGTALDHAIAASRGLRSDQPMVFGEVDADTIAAVVADWTGVPVGRMVKDDIAAALVIEDRLKERVVGQDAALDAIARRIRISRARLDDPVKPVGVFLLCGPSGVGKTETAHALAELLYSGDDSLIAINMSEFQEAHTVSTLKGAPAGYVGFGQGGVLTEAVRRRPYAVVLLDEIEKAHPDVHEMFFQVFDKGYMEDAEGRFIDFRNTLILLTSNIGTDTIAALCADDLTAPDGPGLADAIRDDLLQTFPPALLGRLKVLAYRPLDAATLTAIVRLQLGRIARRLADNHVIRLRWDEAVVDLIVSRCRESASGGRMIDAILTGDVLPELSTMVLRAQALGDLPAEIALWVDDDELAFRAIETDGPQIVRAEAAE